MRRLPDTEGVSALALSPSEKAAAAPDGAAELRALPRVDALLQAAGAERLVRDHGRGRVRDAIRAALDEARHTIREGGRRPEAESLLAAARQRLDQAERRSLRRVVNASGVIVHTNLGRAPLSEEAIEAMVAVAGGYSNLEYDLERGVRGSRYEHCGALLARLAGAEDGLAVNNNAASVMILLAAFARGREVAVSRGQLVEIGGGFRIPDVMAESGARLVEVGTTNRTYAADYARASNERTAAFMTIHRSNFRMTGFVHDPEPGDLARLAHERGLLLIDDLGSGTFLATEPYGLPHEPTVPERVAAGADLVCFSGDKLLGGPQAGFIVGRKALIDTLKGFPMLRALRVDKVTLAGIEATLHHYARGDAAARIPVWRAIAAPLETLAERAERWRRRLALPGGAAAVLSSTSAVGGGSLPGLTLPTRALAVRVPAPDRFTERLRGGDPPVVARIEDGLVVLDPRTVMPDEDDALVEAVRAVMASTER